MGSGGYSSSVFLFLGVVFFSVHIFTRFFLIFFHTSPQSIYLNYHHIKTDNLMTPFFFNISSFLLPIYLSICCLCLSICPVTITICLLHIPTYKGIQSHAGCSGTIFFTIYCNLSLAYIAVGVLQSSQSTASVQSLLLAGNILYN